MFNLVPSFDGRLIGFGGTEVCDPRGLEPKTIIRTTDPFIIKVDLGLSGMVAPYLSFDLIFKAFVESIGPGDEKQVGATQRVPLSVAPPLPTPRSYNTTIEVAAGELGEGAYKLLVLITCESGGMLLEMVALVDGPIIQVYDSLPT